MGVSIANVLVAVLLSLEAGLSSPARDSTQAERPAGFAAAREQLLRAKRIVDDAMTSGKVGADRNDMLRPAIELFRQSLVAGDRPQQLEALLGLALLYGRDLLYEPLEEEAALTRLVELAPGEISGRLRLAEVQEGLREIDLAEQTLRQAKVDFPDQAAKANRALAQFYNRRVIDADQERAKLVAQPGAQVPRNEPPRLLIGEMPSYPPTAPPEEEATVVVEASITETGKVVAVKVLQSTPALDSTAVAAVQRWMFAPAFQAGRPVPSKITIPVVFKKSKSKEDSDAYVQEKFPYTAVCRRYAVPEQPQR